MYKNIVFDFYGVVVKNVGFFVEIMQLTWYTKEFIRKNVGPVLLKMQSWKLLTYDDLFLELSSNLWEEKAKKIVEASHKIANEDLEVYEDVFDFIKELQEKWYRCILLSDVPYTSAKNNKKYYDKFDDVILSYQCWYSKLDAVENNNTKIFDYMLESYSLKAEECLFIDDKEKNITKAMEVWIEWVLCETSSQMIADVREKIFG